MTASVIIPAYNASATIARALNALARQDFRGPFEVIVVDDGSTDDTPAIVKNFPSVLYARQGNAGPAAARNHGARLAKGQYLCFTDSDCVPHPDWISCLLQGFSSPEIGVVSGSYGIANPTSPLARGIHAEIVFRHKYLLPDFPKAFGSYNFCARTDVFGQVGGFHAGYRQASGEDNDLSYKILKAGYRIYFQRKALVDHHHTDKLGKYLKEQFRHGFWRVKMYADHPGMARGDDYTFWKDMLEVPWAFACVLGMVFSGAAYVLSVSFFIFEMFFAWRMVRGFFDAIFFTFVMFLRAFARAAGLSTGIIYFLAQRIEKKPK